MRGLSIRNDANTGSVGIVNENAQEVNSSATLSNGTLKMSGWGTYTVQGIIHAAGNNGNTQPAPNTPPTAPASVPYAATVDGQVFYSDQGEVYERAGGAAFPIKPKDVWTDSDSRYWGSVPVGPVPTDQTHDHEAGWTGDQRSVGAHPPRDGTDVYIDGGNGQQYYFLNGKAFPIGVGELTISVSGTRPNVSRPPETAWRTFWDYICPLPTAHSIAMPAQLPYGRLSFSNRVARR